MRERPHHIWLRALLVLFLGLAPAAAAAAPLQPSAADHGWLFDDAPGSGSASPAFGTDAASLLGNADFDADTPFGYAGNASLLLDGSGDAAEVASLNGALNGASAFSLSLWVRSTATGQNRAFFSGSDPSNADTFGGRYDQAGWLNGNSGTTELIKFGLMVSGANVQYESAGGYQTTAWQHILFTWESGVGASLYVDGVLDTPSEVSPEIDRSGTPLVGALSDQTRFLIGNGPKDYWSGRIDELAVWRQALSQDEAQWLAANSLSAVPEPPAAWLLAGLLLALLTALPRTTSPRRPRLLASSPRELPRR